MSTAPSAGQGGEWIKVREPDTDRILFEINPARHQIRTLLSYWNEEQHKRERRLVVTDLSPLLPTTADRPA